LSWSGKKKAKTGRLRSSVRRKKGGGGIGVDRRRENKGPFPATSKVVLKALGGGKGCYGDRAEKRKGGGSFLSEKKKKTVGGRKKSTRTTHCYK